MSSQASKPTVRPTTPDQVAWVSLLRAHAAATRRFNAELMSGHGLTLNDYEVLLRLVSAPDRRMRRVDLANEIVLTPSGITRLLAGLEREGYVERDACASDGRVAYALLTDAGYEKLRDASSTHVEGIRAHFGDRFSDDELETLAELLARLPLEGSDPENCSV